MNFIKKIVEGKSDEEVHLQFIKFSKGEFKWRALIEAKNSSGKFTIKTSSEFVNELVKEGARRLGDSKTMVKGCIVSTDDLKNKLNYNKISQFQGVKRYMLETQMSGNEILALIEKMPKNFFALSFCANNFELKTKAKAPKSGKPAANKEEVPAPDFCILKTTDQEIAKNFVFEKPDFKIAKISHTFLIKEIIIPKNETDFAKIRENALRKGVMIRMGEIDGDKIYKEIEFQA